MDSPLMWLAALAIPLGHLAVGIGVTVFLFVAYRLTEMRGWLILGASWALGCLGGLPSLYGQWKLRTWGAGEYGHFVMNMAYVSLVVSAVTTVLTIAGFVVLLSECRRLLARRAA